MQFLKNEINAEINKTDAKSINVFLNNKVLKNYLALINKMNNELETMCVHEVGLFSKSLYQWLQNRTLINISGDGPISIGDICMIDWGINYKPELSYYHPAIILEEINNMYLVIPSSTKSNVQAKAYHPIENPTGKWYWRKVGVNDGFAEDCVLLLDNIKVISATRVIKKIGKLTSSLNDENGLFREIRSTIIKKSFRGEYKKYKNLQIELEQFKKQNAEYKDKVIELEEINKKLRVQIKVSTEESG